MKIRVEVRHPVRTEHPLSMRRRPVVQDRLRAVLVLPGGERVALPPKPLPFESDHDIGRFVRDSAAKIRSKGIDEPVVERLATQLWMQAETFRIAPEVLVLKREREAKLAERARWAITLRDGDAD